jgi:predicted CXXCH cytochrome family protein
MNKIIVVVFTLISSSAFAQIAATKHNLSNASGNSVRSSTAGGTNQVCVFCHVPHKARADKNAAWNRSDPSSSASWGSATTTVGGTTLSSTIGKPSLECFSCHDGTSNIGSVISSPTGSALSMVGTGAGGTMTSGAAINPSSLAGNHPVSVRMPSADNGSGTYNGNSTGSRVRTSEFDTLAAAKGSGMLFYTDSDNPAVSGIECGSCHDPHDNSNAPFLRGSLSGSDLCGNCHNK